MSLRTRRSAPTRLLLVAALVSGALTISEPAPAVVIDQNGGITLTVSFELDPEDDDAIFPPVDDVNAQQHYCDAMEDFSEKLYALTEGRHWVERVRFFKDAAVRDVRWYYVEGQSGNHGRASFMEKLRNWEGGHPQSDPSFPYGPALASASALGGLMSHEFGHFFYGLPDEYINFPGSRTGHTGICAGSYGVAGDQAFGTACDEEALQCGGDVCVMEYQCVGGTEADGTGCDEDSDCGAGGNCLATDENRNDELGDNKHRICLHDTNLSPGDDSQGVCLMAGGGLRRRWCDGETHQHTEDDNLNYGVDVAFDLGDDAGEPNGGGDNTNYVDWSCWSEATDVHADLAGAHVQDVYPTLAEVEAEEGPLPAMACDWFVEPVETDTHAALVVDRSGSMGYQELSEPPVESVDLAMDGALYFYNKIDNGDYAGVYTYNTATNVALAGGLPQHYGPKGGNLSGLDDVNASGDTDIADAIQTARVAIQNAGGPISNRNIILFSDGKHNQGGDPFAEAEIACNNGIFVHTIAYGDADSSAMIEMADCGIAWVSGTEQSTGAGYSEPDVLEIKSALARMQHQVDGQTEILEVRDRLEAPSMSLVETREFLVPVDTRNLTFSWLANRTCAMWDTSVTGCRPVLNELVAVELESPSGVVYPAVLTPDAEGGVYRTVVVRIPEPGTWIARVDKTEPNPPPLGGEWEYKVPRTNVTWTAWLEHDGLQAEAWIVNDKKAVDAPVLILGNLIFDSLLTDIEAHAVVTHRGQSWVVPMHDDGAHDDGDAGDGLYGGWFNPDGNLPGVTGGLYRTKVYFSSSAGVARGVFDRDWDVSPEPASELLPPAGDAKAEAETAFFLSPRYSTDPNGRPRPGNVDVGCLDLTPGQTTSGLSATVEGFPYSLSRGRISMGPGVELTVDEVACQNCADLSTDPVRTVLFHATVDPDAPAGPRTVVVQDLQEKLEQEEACRVCTEPGHEVCNGIDDDCNGLVDDGGSAGTNDSDNDTVPDACDNCRFVPNRTQSDADADGEGDACDEDDGRPFLWFDTKREASWQGEGMAWWGLYRGDLRVLRSQGVYTQLPGSNPIAERWCLLPVPQQLDGFEPAPGEVAFYLAEGFDPAGGGTGIGQDGNGLDRPNDNPCP